MNSCRSSPGVIRIIVEIGINSYYTNGYTQATDELTITYYEDVYTRAPNSSSGGKTSTIYLGGFYNARYRKCKVNIISISSNRGYLYVNGTEATLSTDYEYEFDLSPDSSIYGKANYNCDFALRIAITLIK